jgi:hypothetical protein
MRGSASPLPLPILTNGEGRSEFPLLCTRMGRGGEVALQREIVYNTLAEEPES